MQTFAITSRSRSYANDRRPFCHALRRLGAGVVFFVERPMRTLILIALALLSGCASGHNYGGALLLGIFLPDPNELTAEDREIMAREQAEADAAERREVGQ